MATYRLIVTSDRLVPREIGNGAAGCCGCRSVLTRGMVAWVHPVDELASEYDLLWCTRCMLDPSPGRLQLQRVEKADG